LESATGKTSLFSLSGIFTYAGAGDNLYQSFSLTFSYQPNKVFSVQTSLPYVMNYGQNDLTYQEYEAVGIGDFRITAWADFTELLRSIKKGDKAGEKTLEEELPEEFMEDPFADVTGGDETAKESKKEKTKPDSSPHFKFGLGIKLPTGEYDLKDSLGILQPAGFQSGWGVSCLIIGAGYRQSFGKLRAVATLLYDLSGGENSVDYERGDVLRFDASVYYPLYPKYSLIGGIGYSLTSIPQEDIQNGIDVANTDGTFNSIVLLGSMKLYKSLSGVLLLKVPFGSSSSDSANDIDYQYSLGFTYNF